MESPTFNGNYVLFVGEGDFSFSACYTQTNSRNEYIIASCLSLSTLSPTQELNIQIIQKNGGIVYTDVDATKLENHPYIGKIQFSKVTFNFPHIPKKMNIKENRNLVECFLKSARKIIGENGKVVITLCRGQGGTDGDTIKREWGNSWQVSSLAANAGLILCDIEPFDASIFENYECTGFRGQSKPFHMKEAVTHTFCPGQLASFDFLNNLNDDLLESFKDNSRNIYEKSSQKLDTAYTKVLLDLHHTIKSNISSMMTTFIPNLLMCKNLNKFFEDELETSLTCQQCLKQILSLFSNSCRKNSYKVSSVISTVCCTSMIDILKLPFKHLLAYFFPTDVYFEEVLRSLKKQLAEMTEPTKKTTNFSWSEIENIFSPGDKSLSITPSKDIEIKDISPIYTVCSIKKSNCYNFYTDIDIVTSNRKQAHIKTAGKSILIGSIVQFSIDTEKYSVIILNLDAISTLKFHVNDDRILLLKDSFFSFKRCDDFMVPILRSSSLFPPCYVHDTSFWTDVKFNEKQLFLLVRKTVGHIIESVKLIDLYHDKATNRESRCYRFVYKSYNKVLSKQTASNIHSRVIRKAIESSLKVQLR